MNPDRRIHDRPARSPRHGEPTEGAVSTVTRTFTEAEVDAFVAISDDDQPRHTDPDEAGRLMVPGLLTATLPTAISGEDEVLARETTFEFRRPVYMGEKVTCEVTSESVEECEDRYVIRSNIECRNESDAVVLAGGFDDLIEKG